MNEKSADALNPRLQYVGGCVTCQDTFRLAGEVIRASTDKLNEAYALIQALRAELDRANVDANAWSNRAHKAETMLDRARAEARDLERENASLRRRLREGGR